MIDLAVHVGELRRRVGKLVRGRGYDPNVRLDPDRTLKLLFVHTPKTGGQSIGRAIARRYRRRLYLDYDDAPDDPATPANFDPVGLLGTVQASGYPWLVAKDAVMGHLWAKKYEPVRFEIRATVLRDPIERALSLHGYWLARATQPRTVHRYLIEKQLDFMAFARIPIVNRFYVDHMFRDVDMTTFSVIGDQARLRENWSGFVARLGLDAERVLINETRSLDPGYPQRAREILDDPSRMALLRDLFAADLAFYERWAER